MAPVPRRLPGPWWVWCVLGAWAGLVATVGYLAGRAHVDVTLCLFKRITGIPCASCGLTRGVLSVLRGDLAGAWLYNPLAITLLGIAVAWLLLWVVAARRIVLRLSRRERALFWVLVAAAVVCNWAYVIRFVG